MDAIVDTRKCADGSWRTVTKGVSRVLGDRSASISIPKSAKNFWTPGVVHELSVASYI